MIKRCSITVWIIYNTRSGFLGRKVATKQIGEICEGCIIKGILLKLAKRNWLKITSLKFRQI